MANINEPVQKEIEVSSMLQDEVKRIISANNWNEEQVAEKLDLLPSGAEALLCKKKWSIETAFRVAYALGIDMSIDVKK